MNGCKSHDCMNNEFLTRRYMLLLAALTLVLSLLAVGIFHYWPEQAFEDYWLIPIFFLICGRLTIGVSERFASQQPARRAQIYLLVRGIRMVVACVAVAIYAVVSRDTLLPFALAFVINYLFYLAFDTLFFSKYETKN